MNRRCVRHVLVNASSLPEVPLPSVLQATSCLCNVKRQSHVKPRGAAKECHPAYVQNRLNLFTLHEVRSTAAGRQLVIHSGGMLRGLITRRGVEN